MHEQTRQATPPLACCTVLKKQATGIGDAPRRQSSPARWTKALICSVGGRMAMRPGVVHTGGNSAPIRGTQDAFDQVGASDRVRRNLAPIFPGVGHI